MSISCPMVVVLASSLVRNEAYINIWCMMCTRGMWIVGRLTACEDPKKILIPFYQGI
jgi:hypothetical protein